MLLAGNIGWIVRDTSEAKQKSSQLALQGQFPYLSKRILSDNPNDILINFVPLRKDLTARFDALNVQKSFYFEYLPDGTSIRVGSDDQLVAASLIKVPLSMNLYRAAELGRVNLDKTVAITSSEIDNAYGDLWQKGAGTKITLREAAQLALTESDNTAAHVIFDNVKGALSADEESMARLDVDQNMEAGQAVINAKSYASVLKSLYFSSYLEKTDSQQLLSYLTKSTATNRLAKNLPASVPVAHKVGVNNANWAESDCGIVYVPKRPYVICVMVGLHEDQADKFIADVSKIVYDFVSRQ
ncbi:MAG: serine hydrolase [Candidatus Saccharimonadales bacterium]